MKNKGKIIKVTIAVVVALAIVIVGYAVYKNSDAVKVREQLDLGEKYLAELNYDEAIIAYETVIEIEPMNVEAYLGLADAYAGKGDYESAALALQKGYDLTENEAIKSKLDEVNGEIERVKVEEEEANLKEEKRIQEASRTYIELPFNISDFKVMGYDLQDDHFEEVIAAFGCPFSEERLGPEGYIEGQFGEMEAFGGEDGCSFGIKFWGDGSVLGDSLLEINSFGYGIQNNDYGKVYSFSMEDGYKHYIGMDVASFCEVPIVYGNTYEEWCERIGIDIIKSTGTVKSGGVFINGYPTTQYVDIWTKFDNHNYQVRYDETIYTDEYGDKIYASIYLFDEDDDRHFWSIDMRCENGIVAKISYSNTFEKH